MSKLIVRLEEAKKNFDWQDLVDLIDQFVREAEKQEETIKKFEEEKNEWILLNDINRRKIIELEEGNQKNLKEIEKWKNIAADAHVKSKNYLWDLVWADRE
jgi:hypothetical protein